MGDMLYESCIKLQPVFSQAGQLLMNTHYFLSNDPIDLDLLVVAGAKYATWWGSNIRSQQPAAVTLQKVIVTDVSRLLGIAVDVPLSLNNSGTHVSPSLPNNVTVAVKWGTAMRGRSYQGRTYHIGLCADSVSGSSLSTGAAGILQAAYQNLITLGEGELDFRMVITSRRPDLAQLGFGMRTQVVACSVENNIDSQRRRLIGRGR